MIFYDQENIYDPNDPTKRGDCVRACIKTILQRPLLDCPHPIEHSGQWNEAFWQYIDEVLNMELHYRSLKHGQTITDVHGPYVIACGPTERTKILKCQHGVVWDTTNNVMLHDPHPSRAGLIGFIGYMFLSDRE